MAKSMHTEGKPSTIKVQIEGLKEVDESEYVINQEAYEQWKEAKKNPILNNMRRMTASDGTIVDLATIEKWLRKKILHLPEDEQTKLLKFRKIYETINCKANTLKIKAFGTARRKEGVVSASLLEPRRQELIELFGRMFTVDEVHRLVVTEFKLPASIGLIQDFKRIYAKQIFEKQEIHKVQFSDIRLGHKRSRIEELCYMYNRIKDVRFDEKVQIDAARMMKEILKDIKAEVEADITIDIKGHIEVELTINQHLKKEVLSGIGLRQLIIGRVASKQGRSVVSLIQQLSDSYYSNLSGVLRDVAEDVEYEELNKKLDDLPYDFNQIAKLHEIGEEKEKFVEKREKTIFLEKHEKGAGLDLKTRMLQIIEQNKAKNKDNEQVTQIINLSNES